MIALALLLAVSPLRAAETSERALSMRMHLKPAAPGVGLKPCGLLDLSCSPSATPVPFEKTAAGRPQPVPALQVRFGGRKRAGEPGWEVRTGTLLQQALFLAALVSTFAL